jgi:hypothetical protein
VRWIKNLEFPTVAAIVAALACLTIGQGAERFAANLSPSTDPPVEAADAGTRPAPGPTPSFGAVDYATTAALKGGTVALSPCGAPPPGR